MASLGNVVFIDHRIMDVAFLISLTHKNFFSALLLPIPTSSSFFGLYLAGSWLPSPSPAIHQSLINRLCAKFHIAIFSPSCCLYCLFELSTAHISFWVRFPIFWVDWSINGFLHWEMCVVLKIYLLSALHLLIKCLVTKLWMSKNEKWTGMKNNGLKIAEKDQIYV